MPSILRLDVRHTKRRIALGRLPAHVRDRRHRWQRDLQRGKQKPRKAKRRRGSAHPFILDKTQPQYKRALQQLTCAGTW